MKNGLLSFSLIIAFMSSCSYPQLEFEKPDGKYNFVKKGKKFCVSLPEDHTTKYLWSVSHTYNKSTISYIQSVFHGKTVEFNFEAIKPGKTEMTFYLYSNKDTSEVKSFLVEVE